MAENAREQSPILQAMARVARCHQGNIPFPITVFTRLTARAPEVSTATTLQTAASISSIDFITHTHYLDYFIIFVFYNVFSI